MTKGREVTLVQWYNNSPVDTVVPTVLFTDNGPPFSAEELRNFCRRWGIRHVTSSPYYPQSNSFAENCKALLRKCLTNGKMDYEAWGRGLLAVRNTPHASAGLSPAIILYGHPVQDVIPAHKSSLSKGWWLAEFDKQIAAERQKANSY